MGDGTMQWDAGRTWYRVAGELGGDGPAPVVILHGGPGAAHDYLESLAQLPRPTVLYDQLGADARSICRMRPRSSGRHSCSCVSSPRCSTTSASASATTSSASRGAGCWGWSTRSPAARAGIAGHRQLAGVDRAVGQRDRPAAGAVLPIDVQQALTTNETAGTTDSEEYQRAMMVFYERHLCRIVPFPDALRRTSISWPRTRPCTRR